MIPRTLSSALRKMPDYFPVVFLNGPRQSGKTTLIRDTFPGMPYYSLENPDLRLLAEDDPRGFLANLPEGGILDEVQRVPHLFNYLQEVVDTHPGRRFILSGSQNFLLHEKISQSLSGRAGLLTLLPMCTTELVAGLPGFEAGNWERLIFEGFYPALHARAIPAGLYYSSYLATYLERDVRLIRNIGDMSDFSRFVKLCAGRAGQILNLSSLAADTGVSPNTAKSWLSALEASYVVFTLNPYHKNFNKRLVKMPRLYFYDTGLLCHLLDLKEAGQVGSHYAVGALFENLVIAELIKHYYNRAQRPPLFFWRDNKGSEVDLVVELGAGELSMEIKAGKTRQSDFFKGLAYWQKISGNPPERSFVVYGGKDNRFSTTRGTYIPWNRVPDWIAEVF